MTRRCFGAQVDGVIGISITASSSRLLKVEMIIEWKYDPTLRITSCQTEMVGNVKVTLCRLKG